jgi:hypothetical protein
MLNYQRVNDLTVKFGSLSSATIQLQRQPSTNDVVLNCHVRDLRLIREVQKEMKTSSNLLK